ncbi:MAG: penicillin-binding protein 2 [Phycisphaeraceae bacterium]|nr:penicillin-binding protein 2 [Phycisphaeraceae bacterium]
MASDTTQPGLQPGDRLAGLRRVAMEETETRQRGGRFSVVATILALAITLGYGLMAARVIHLQNNPPQPIAERVGMQHGTIPLIARRGTLLDRKGRVLASTGVAWKLFADSQIIGDPVAFAQKVGQELDYPATPMAKAIIDKLGSRFIVLDPEMDDVKASKVLDLRLPGLGRQMYLERHYPMKTLAGQLIGFVGTDDKGLEGLERYFNAELTATPGQVDYVRAANRRPLWIQPAGYQLPQTASAVRLSLDVAVQAIAEEELEAACRKFEGKSGQLIVMDPSTGEILAMANYPFFDPGSFETSKPDARRNRCITDVFEPGSIFKPFVWAVATERGTARPTELIDCHNGLYVTPIGRRLRDAHPYGLLTWESVLIKSSNIGMAVVGQRMGNTALFSAIRSFGFGLNTGSKLPGESAGMVRPLRSWGHYSETSVPMGQEIGVTAMQLVRGMAILANDGQTVVPTVLLKDPDDPSIPELTVREQAIKPQTAKQVRQILRRVVVEGTGRQAASELYSIWGKTGTAQIADHKRGGYLEGAYVGSFLGGAPLDHPRIVVGCFIHRPNPSKGYYGGTISAPAVKNVIDRTLIYLNQAPDLEPKDTDVNAIDEALIAMDRD